MLSENEFNSTMGLTEEGVSVDVLRQLSERKGTESFREWRWYVEIESERTERKRTMDAHVISVVKKSLGGSQNLFITSWTDSESLRGGLEQRM